MDTMAASTSFPLAGRILDVRVVERPPTWRDEPITLTYLLAADELTGAELASTYREAAKASLVHPRVLSPFVVQWSSLFNPRFFYAVERSRTPTTASAVVFQTDIGLNDVKALTRFWLESVVFLSGVTLSAAIVQSRWSSGTIESKYDRLWQAGVVAADASLAQVAALGLLAAVKDLARDHHMPALDRLLALRRLFEATIASLSNEVPVETATMRAAPTTALVSDRFGFIEDLRNVTGRALQSVIVYGSSISSEDFADYDLVLVSARPEETLRRLAGTSPSWRGKELNVSVYSPEDLWNTQILSGDNLSEYGLCLFGEAEVPVKPRQRLLARNLSFGVVRQRQQLGMIGSALRNLEPPPDDDRRNLYGYFVKIPANVVKGTLGASGRRVSKEAVQGWLAARCGFDTAFEQRRAMAGQPGEALADAAVATGSALRQLNAEFAVVSEPAPAPTGAGEGFACQP